jgi:hypothetical protein
LFRMLSRLLILPNIISETAFACQEDKCFLTNSQLYFVRQEWLLLRRCFLACPLLGNVARKFVSRDFQPLRNVERKQSCLACLLAWKHGWETMFPTLLTFGKHD